MNNLRHVPQTWTNLGDLLNSPAHGLPKFTSSVGVSQFRHVRGVARRHADLSAAQGMRLSSTPSQAKPGHVPGPPAG
jgi:hypothetical protein